MITVSRVKGSKDVREFVELPLRMYKDCPYFVPPLYSDEIKLVKSGGATETSDSVFFLAKRDGKTVGRIQGIIQKQHNELKNEKRVRFTRFDCENDSEISRALFSTLEDWARENGMEQICGPLGYSDLDREGLLIEGFEENSTFEEQYNYEYYAHLIEDMGFEKEVDWLEFELTAPDKKNDMLDRVAKRALEMNNLHIADRSVSSGRYIRKYKDTFFDCLDECYSKLYGVAPLTKAQRKELVSQFKLVINPKFTVFICDETERIVAFGMCFPGFGDTLKKSGGRLTPPTAIRLLKAIKHPETFDMGLVAVLPEYQSSGINAVMISEIIDMLMSGGAWKFETNLNLETNIQVMAQWKYFKSRQHKRRRAYLKTLETEKDNV